MTHNNKIYDLLYFKAIIEDYNIKLESIHNEKVDDEDILDDNDIDIIQNNKNNDKSDDFER